MFTTRCAMHELKTLGKDYAGVLKSSCITWSALLEACRGFTDIICWMQTHIKHAKRYSCTSVDMTTKLSRLQTACGPLLVMLCKCSISVLSTPCWRFDVSRWPSSQVKKMLDTSLLELKTSSFAQPFQKFLQAPPCSFL